MMDVKQFIDKHLPPVDWNDVWEAFYINTPASTVVELIFSYAWKEALLLYLQCYYCVANLYLGWGLNNTYVQETIIFFSINHPLVGLYEWGS